METNVVVEVSGSIIGIEEADVPFIFDPFYRADKARSVYSGGTGLGLAIVKKIIEMQGNTIAVSSKTGNGTTVRVGLSSFDKKSGCSPFSHHRQRKKFRAPQRKFRMTPGAP